MSLLYKLLYIFIIFHYSILYFFRSRNVKYLPQKPVIKKETTMKKSESAYMLDSQNQVKREIIETVNNCDKKSKS